MSQQLLNAVTKSYMKTDIPEFRAGDTVKVHVRIKEGEKERIQVFEGLVIYRHDFFLYNRRDPWRENEDGQILSPQF